MTDTAPRGRLRVAAARPAVRRFAARTLLALAVVITVLTVAVVVAAWLDDRAIDARTGVATAEVVDDSPTRTLIRFTTRGGAVQVPEHGVYYPGGLQAGQLVRVEYDTADPQLVRVQGRSVLLGVVPALLLIAAVWVLVVPAVWWLRRTRSRP